MDSTVRHIDAEVLTDCPDTRGLIVLAKLLQDN